jgi:repressor of nif and glnA expression
MKKEDIIENFRRITRIGNKIKKLENGLMFEKMDYDFKPRKIDDKLYGMYSVTFDETNIFITVFSNEYKLDSQVILNLNSFKNKTFDELYEIIYDKCDDIHKFCLGKSEKIQKRCIAEFDKILVKHGLYEKPNTDILRGCKASIENFIKNRY